jgi:hypothetical protein
MQNLIKILIICMLLSVAVTLLPVIQNAFAKVGFTLAGDNSTKKCFDKPPPSMVFRPHYANVNPNNPFAYVTGQVIETHVSHEDFYFDHYSHDSNFIVLLNDPFYNLNSIANEVGRTGKLLMEMEWEIGFHNDGRTDRCPK